MKLHVMSTEGHQGKELDVDLQHETLSLRSSNGEVLGSITWGALITFIQSSMNGEGPIHPRAFPRAPLAIKVRYTTPEGKHFESVTGGLGGGGLFIESSAPLPPGSDVSLEFSLPDRPFEKLTAKARVAWTRAKTERHVLFPGMGVEFTDITTESRARVQELVEALNRTRQLV